MQAAATKRDDVINVEGIVNYHRTPEATAALRFIQAAYIAGGYLFAAVLLESLIVGNIGAIPVWVGFPIPGLVGTFALSVLLIVLPIVFAQAVYVGPAVGKAFSVEFVAVILPRAPGRFFNSFRVSFSPTRYQRLVLFRVSRSPFGIPSKDSIAVSQVSQPIVFSLAGLTRWVKPIMFLWVSLKELGRGRQFDMTFSTDFSCCGHMQVYHNKEGVTSRI